MIFQFSYILYCINNQFKMLAILAWIDLLSHKLSTKRKIKLLSILSQCNMLYIWQKDSWEVPVNIVSNLTYGTDN